MQRRGAIGLAALSAAVLWTGRAFAADEDALFDAAGFRRARYRAPIDRPVTPAAQIALADALKLRAGHDARFYDVLPAENGIRDPATGRWTLPAGAVHATIPGARWFPEVGRAPVDPPLWRGFAEAVTRGRQRHPRWPVVIFCRADCWMSWNAARRLALAGIADVGWLAEGIDGWHDAGIGLMPAQPEATADHG